MPVLTKINTNSIAEDAITGDKFAGDAYLANTANQNISGTYSENRLYTSDAYTLSGNATINNHLTLSSVKPTADVVLTASGAYTITGTGVLSAGTLLAPANTDASTLTGELGSVVTGSPNLNLGNATFPARMTLQTKVAQIAVGITGNTNTGSVTEIHTGLRIDFTPVSSLSKIIFTLHAGNAIAQSADIELRVRYNTSSNTAPNTSFGNNKTSGDRQGANAQIFTLNHLTFEDSWSGLRCVSPCYGSSNGNSVKISNATHVTFFMIQEISQDN